MPFITRKTLNPELRSDAERSYKDQLRQKLRDPSLTNEQRQRLMEELEQVGQPKIYGADPIELSQRLKLEDLL